MAPVETEYYDLRPPVFRNSNSGLVIQLIQLGVPVDVNDTDLKKAYRKAAMRYHPDKNPSPDAEENEAYRVLSDSNLRVVYDKNGKKMVSKEGGQNVEDAASFFANVFGGERFMDYIGEISLMKDMTNVANTMLSEEEKAEAEAVANGAAGSSATASTSTEPHLTAPPPKAASAVAHEPSAPSSDAAARPLSSYALPSQDAFAPSPSTSTPLLQTSVAAGSSVSAPATPVSPHPKKRSKMTPEQREKLLVERLRPFVGAKNPGGPGDPETVAWEARMRREADDLKLESFGVELLHAIGTVYVTKASSFLKSRKFLGMDPTRPGFWSKLKEKGAVAKDAWGVIGSALSVQQVMQDIERAQLKGDVGEEELKALEIDVTWQDHARVLARHALRSRPSPPRVRTTRKLYHRARGLLLLGAIFKSTVPGRVGRRAPRARAVRASSPPPPPVRLPVADAVKLLRMVAEAAKPKKKQAPPSAAAASRGESRA
ncbi:X-domain of DnaJ-containing-domain-containing protein [Lactarius sanguifluus]|nr:X-domain of DnaJ-containing-domain-containing protein [Lactarius sanguifluus]